MLKLLALELLGVAIGATLGYVACAYGFFPLVVTFFAGLLGWLYLATYKMPADLLYDDHGGL